jgi:hypothetical protein
MQNPRQQDKYVIKRDTQLKCELNKEEAKT